MDTEAGINRDGHFLLTEVVIKNRLAKSIFGGRHYKKTGPKMPTFFEAVIYKKAAFVIME